jgi:hypothetical protein
MNQNSRPSEDKKTGLELLREPFPDRLISKKPKFKRDPNVPKAQNVYCKECGQYHPKEAIHLDYVGHAALTNRLLDADPEWNWEPLAVDESGLPRMDRFGGMWIKLTVCGVTRLGYGHAEGKQGGDAIKEVIGDALRNAAMRFGAALDLWCKGDLHAEDENASQEAERAELEERARKQTDHLTAIDSAENAEALERAAKEAKEWATKYKDRQAWASFSQHEKARKKQLGIEVAA